MPVVASPATASPATIATVIGRNTGSTSASAAAGNSCPSVTTADRNAPPWPGGGGMSATASTTATSAGSAHSNAQHSHTRRRPSISRSSMPIIGPITGRSDRPRCRSRPAPPAPASAAPPPARSPRIPAATRRALSAAASAARTWTASPSRCSTCPSMSPTTAAGSGVRTTIRPVGPRSASSSSTSTSRPASSTPTRVHSASTSVEQVARQEHRRAGRVEAEQQLPHLADAPGIEAVRRLVEHQELGGAQQGGGDPQPLPHPERVRAHRTGVHARQPDLVQCPLDALGPVAAPPTRARGVEQPQVRRARTASATRPDPRPARRPAAAPRRRASASPRPAARPSPTWDARARAASARAWSCRSRWGRAARTAIPSATARSTPSTAVTRPKRLVRPETRTAFMRAAGTGDPRAPAAARPVARPRPAATPYDRGSARPPRAAWCRPPLRCPDGTSTAVPPTTAAFATAWSAMSRPHGTSTNAASPDP